MTNEKEIIHAIKEMGVFRTPYEKKGVDAVVSKAIKALEAQTGWTPVSEGLPKDDEDVIVSVLDDYGDTPWEYTTVAWLCNGTWISDNDILCGTVIAWMPLPKPYTERREP